MILLDTHAILWDALTPERLSLLAQQAIEDANSADGILICDISLWEIAMLVAKGRVQVSLDCQSFLNLVLQARKITVQPITPRIAALTTLLSDKVNRDPADRLILATAMAENALLVTADRNLRAHAPVPTLW